MSGGRQVNGIVSDFFLNMFVDTQCLSRFLYGNFASHYFTECAYQSCFLVAFVLSMYEILSSTSFLPVLIPFILLL